MTTTHEDVATSDTGEVDPDDAGAPPPRPAPGDDDPSVRDAPADPADPPADPDEPLNPA